MSRGFAFCRRIQRIKNFYWQKIITDNFWEKFLSSTSRKRFLIPSQVSFFFREEGLGVLFSFSFVLKRIDPSYSFWFFFLCQFSFSPHLIFSFLYFSTNNGFPFTRSIRFVGGSGKKFLPPLSSFFLFKVSRLLPFQINRSVMFVKFFYLPSFLFLSSSDFPCFFKSISMIRLKVFSKDTLLLWNKVRKLES